MGEVYRARDVRLQREVAIKVLPAHIAGREELRSRFEREARAVASLNHPHICTLYDIGPGYMVMELVEGETLADRLKKGALSVEQALTWAVQIADALDRAHRAGVTHRDVKPQNLMVTRDGAKVLDFGLAKSQAKPGPNDATLTQALTGEGTVMGTPQYMAPEQFEGREADARSDIWAFGAVLYEMLTGQRAFQGKTYSSLVGAILAADPPSMPAQRFTPTWLESLVRRCLQKDPEDRYQSMRDLVLDLRQPRAAETRRPEDRRWRWAAGAMAAVLAMGAGAGWVLSEAGGAANGRPVRFTVTPVGNGVFTTPPNTSVAAPQFALAPDGSALVFVAGPLSGPSLLWLRPLAEAVARPVAGTENALLPFWSPDSQWIGYFSDKQLKKVPARGGASQVLASDIADVFGGSWGPDQTIIFSAGAESISRIPAAGGTPSHVTVLNGARGEVAHRWTHFLPDGRHFLFYARAAREYGGLYLGSLDGSAAKFLFRSDSSAIYAPPGYLLYVEGDTLMARRFDARRLVAGGEAVALEEGVGRTTTSFSAVSAAAGGLLAYSGSIVRPGRLTWFDRRGIAIGNVLDEADYIDFRLSPNEKRLAYEMVDRKTNSPKIWTADLERGSNTRITLGADTNVSVVWSPDGERIRFRSAQLGSSRFYLPVTISGCCRLPAGARRDRSSTFRAIKVMETFLRTASWWLTRRMSRAVLKCTSRPSPLRAQGAGVNDRRSRAALAGGRAGDLLPGVGWEADGGGGDVRPDIWRAAGVVCHAGTNAGDLPDSLCAGRERAAVPRQRAAPTKRSAHHSDTQWRILAEAVIAADARDDSQP